MKLISTCAAVCALAFTMSLDAQAEDALDKIQARGILTICADPYNWPHSSSTDYPRGFDVEIFSQIAANNGWQTEIYWSNTGTRGGLGRALRNSIAKGRCQIFAGIAVHPDNVDEIGEKGLVFSAPYLGLAYIPVVDPELAHVATLEEIAQHTDIGVAMSTAMDGYLIDNGIERELYLGNRRVLDGLRNRETKAAMVWAPALAIERRRHKDANYSLIEAFEPIAGLRWNVGAAIPNSDTRLIDLINAELATMLADGTIESIVTGYQIPYFAPFPG